MMHIKRYANSLPSRRGLSMVETVMAIVMVSVLLVAALNTLGASQLGQLHTSTHAIGNTLAQTLMAEIISQAYEDPDGFPTFGLETSENSANRLGFDDVDDYVDWTIRAPQKRDGMLQSIPIGWERGATVEWVDPSDLTTTSVTSTGVKRITVTTTYNGTTIVDLVAIRTAGPPEPATGIRVLFVVVDPASLTVQETAKRDLMASWGFVIELIAENAPTGDYSTADFNYDVAYVSLDVTNSLLPGKIKNQWFGIVNEQWLFLDDFGIGSGIQLVTEINIWAYDNTHYIMSGYPDAALAMLTTVQPMFVITGSIANGAQQVGLLRRNGPVYYPALTTLVKGALIYGGGIAAGRRVQLPWGAPFFDINALNDDGRVFMKRSIEWAASMEATAPPPSAICGDATCDAGEDSCNCPADCGAPSAFETTVADCSDGIDNDCNGLIDCDDLICGASPSCAPVAIGCGNGLCEAGEDCNSCGADCDSVTVGNPANRYCCGDGTLQTAEGDGTICNGNP